MFNSLTGTITAKLPASIYLEINGVEWDLTVPSLSVDAFGPVGSTARVYTWLYHREDQMRMFGFSSVRERDLFYDLMKVEGVGPKQAIKILSSIAVEELEAALEGGDVTRIQAAPGVGLKTAQKMILALKGKLTYVSESAKGRAQAAKSEHDDVIQALTGMGFDRRRAFEAVEAIAAELEASGIKKGSEAFEKELFRRGIVALST
ncbi:MAG TPA: Holliday junction branch migration protein RuvA [Treponemataceae bacterium]|nr:Holliday junction branch migration protein RuvA [Treponemataceae bacterium]HPS44722.1 Holliday junction branch migration protein RuvA [Treponemataceae bacterium]